MRNKDIIKSLPLLASVLGRKYGVQVEIGGDRAYTDGSTIHLPSLPVNGDDILLGTIRGFLDHESAHIRDSDFLAVQAANLTPLEKHVWNSLEDWRVENKLASIYPGCRQNFQWLIKHLFLPKPKTRPRKAQRTEPAMQLLDWLLVTFRSWDVPELDDERELLRAKAEIFFPGLTHEMEPVLRATPSRCSSTTDAIVIAREITEILKKYAQSLQQQLQDEADAAANAQDGQTTSGKTMLKKAYALQSLQRILSAGEGDLTGDLGSTLQDVLADACKNPGELLKVAVLGKKRTRPLSSEEMDHARQVTTALRTRIQALLQSARAIRNHNGYIGTLNIRKLHTLAIGNAKVFLRRGEQAGVNTAIHILLDSSGSMQGTAIAMASEACFAIASALHDFKGINLGVTTFPGITDRMVAPILRHNQKMHSLFGMDASGCTPMDAALWWVLQQIHLLSEPRKIILLITDGEPDDLQQTHTAIKALQNYGIEIYGIGINNPRIFSLLAGQHCRNIQGINELAPAMFEILQNALIGGSMAA